MLRSFSQRLAARSFLSTVAGLVSFAAVTAACSAGAATSGAATTSSQALTEATASAADTHAAAEACFTAFDSCKAAATAATDVTACKTTLDSCLPVEARPGPHCGPPPGMGDRRPGDDDGDHDGPGACGAASPPPPPPDGGLPGFCKDVPLPPPAAIAACKAPLDECLSAGTDKKTCFDAAHACIKAAFDAALPPPSAPPS